MACAIADRERGFNARTDVYLLHGNSNGEIKESSRHQQYGRKEREHYEWIMSQTRPSER